MSIKKILLGIAIILIIAIVGIGSYVYINANKIAEDIVRNNLIKDYNQNQDTQYLINLEEIDFNLIDGSVDLINLSVIPKDSIVTFQSEIDQKNIPNTSVVVKIERISLLNFNFKLAVTGRKIVVDKFKIIKPVINIYKHIDLPDTLSEKQDTVNFKAIFLTEYDTYRVNKVLIKDMSASFYQITNVTDTFKLFTVKNVSYKITEVVAHEQSLSSAPYFHYKEYSLHSKDIEVKIHNKSTIRIEAIDFESKTNELIIKSLEFNPLMSPKEYFKQQRFRKAWLQLKVKQISLNNFNFESWIESQHIVIDSAIITQPVLSVFTNSTIPFNPKENKPMLGQVINAIPTNIYVKDVRVKDALIRLDMFDKHSPKHGKLSFNHMNINAKNLTNINSRFDSNSLFLINVKTQINNTGNVNASLAIDLSHPKSKTKFNVRAKNLDLLKFNSVLEPLVLVGVTDGEMVSLKISSTISTDGGVGSMDANYTNMKVLFKEKDVNKETGFFLKMASGLANGIVKSNNIPGTSNYRTGKISFQKSKLDSFFKMLWLVTLNGLEDSILGSTGRDNRHAKKAQKESQTKAEGKSKSKKNSKMKPKK